MDLIFLVLEMYRWLVDWMVGTAGHLLRGLFFSCNECRLLALGHGTFVTWSFDSEL